MRRILFILCTFTFTVVQGQNILSIDEAVSMALKNNFDITIAKNEALISQTNNTAGAAGMLPTVSISGSGNYALRNNNSRTTANDAYTTTDNGVTTLNAGAELNWTLYDGGKMFVTKAKLNEIESLGEIQFKQQVMQTLSEVIAAYFNLVKQKQQLLAINQVINYSQERVTIAESGFNSGLKMKTDLLQAKIDLNVNRQNGINQDAAILSAKRELARLLVVSEASIEVSTEVPLDYTPNRDELQQRLYNQNNTILAFQKQLDIQQLTIKEGNSYLLPKVNFNTGYYFQSINTANQSTNQTGTNRTLWPQIGASVSMPLFQGGNLKRAILISKINLDLAQYDLENIKLQINTELSNALTAYENQQKLLEIERESYDLSKENMEISLKRMRLGEATSLEVRMAQSDFENSATRLTNIQYNLKMAETHLKQLMGEL